MKLLFDQNLSPSLVHRLADVLPESSHVRDFGLSDADDSTIWAHAKREGLTIVSKDSDFRQRAFMHGPPPKVISIGLGNCTTTQVEALLRARASDIRYFVGDPQTAILILP
jgi:predicted nuclease of predicted toxin-antitoxin system